MSTFINTIIIAAAGRGTRFGQLTVDQPKHLLPVAGKPFLWYVMEAVQRAGFERIIVVIDYQAQQMEEFFQTYSYDVEVVRQSTEVGDRYGSAAVFEAASHKLAENEPAVVLNGDSLFPETVLHMLRINDGNHHILVARHDQPQHYGVVDCAIDGTLKEIIEKPVVPPSNLINVGLYVCQPDFALACQEVSLSARGEYEITDAFNALAHSGRVKCDQWSGDWVDYGKPEDVHAVEEFVKKYYV